MSISQITTRDTQLEKQRLGFDATMLELDTVPKVSVGSVVEASGALYVVSSAAETPTGSAVDGAYLFFDPSGPSFVWSAVAGTYDATKGGIYDGSNRRQCQFLLSSATLWNLLHNLGPGSIETKRIEIGDWNMQSTANITVAHGLTLADIREVEVQIRDDAASIHYQWAYDAASAGFFTTGAVNVTLVRAAGAPYESVNFNATSFNRGWILARWET